MIILGCDMLVISFFRKNFYFYASTKNLTFNQEGIKKVKKKILYLLVFKKALVRSNFKNFKDFLRDTYIYELFKWDFFFH